MENSTKNEALSAHIYVMSLMVEHITYIIEKGVAVESMRITYSKTTIHVSSNIIPNLKT